MIQPRDANDLYYCWQLGLLPLTIWREAGGESYEGKVAVGESIVNRMKDHRWGDDIDSVVLQKWQYSCYNEGDPVSMRMPKPGDMVFQDCCRAAMEALNGSNLTQGANHYLNVRVVEKATGKLPSWYRKEDVTAIIGNHEFLRL